jgi:hypothetical protein
MGHTVKMQYLSYTCPTCFNRSQIPNATEPLRCMACNCVVCPSCSQHDFCFRCGEYLTPEEYQRLKFDASKSGSTCLMAILFLIGVIFPFIAFAGWVIEDMQWIGTGVGGFIVISFLCYLMNKKDNTRITRFKQFKQQLSARIDIRKRTS